MPFYRATRVPKPIATRPGPFWSVYFREARLASTLGADLTPSWHAVAQCYASLAFRGAESAPRGLDGHRPAPPPAPSYRSELAASRRIERAMTSRWIWLVPS